METAGFEVYSKAPAYDYCGRQIWTLKSRKVYKHGKLWTGTIEIEISLQENLCTI